MVQLSQGLLGALADPFQADIVGSFQRGQETKRLKEERERQERSRKQMGEILGATLGGKLGALGSSDPKAALALAEGLGIPRSEKERLEAFVGEVQTATAIANGSGPQDAATYLAEVIDRKKQLGIDTSRMDGMLNHLVQNPQEGVEALNLMTDALAEQGFIKAPKTGAASAVTKILSDGTTIQALPNGKVQVTSRLGEVVEGDLRIEVLDQARRDELALARTKSGEKAAGTQAIKISTEAFNKLEPIKKSIGNMNDAIAALDAGATTGPIMSRLPSIRASSVQLDNIQKRMGLDVVGTTTFGALSAGELDLALSVALPIRMSPAALRTWLVEKRDAQKKLSSYLENVAIYLGTPGNTAADWVSAQQELQQIEPQAVQSGTAQVVDLSTLSDEELLQLRQGTN